jgi:hypothetical protein
VAVADSGSRRPGVPILKTQTQRTHRKMSTATKKNPAKKKTALADIELAERRVEEARRELQATRERERQHAGKIGALRTSRLDWQVRHPEEFGSDGANPAGSQAEKLTKAVQEEVGRYEAAEHGQAIETAEIRLRAADEEAKRTREQRGREALADLLPQAEAAVKRFKSWAEGGQEAIAALHEVSHRASAICVSMRIDAREVPSYDHWVRIVTEAERSSNPPLPLPSSALAREEDE